MIFEQFRKGQWKEENWIRAYTFRYQETPALHQEEDCISSKRNESHPEGFDNVSLLHYQPLEKGAGMEMTCAFEGNGCPEIILVPEIEKCPDGNIRYGACFEIVMYRGGVNVWRHFREEGKCSWHKRLGLRFNLEEHALHRLSVEIRENELAIKADGYEAVLRTEDLPQSFYGGITMCEGAARVYNMKIKEKGENECVTK